MKKREARQQVVPFGFGAPSLGAESLTRKRRVRRRSRFRRRRSPLKEHKKKRSDTTKRVAVAFGTLSDSRRISHAKRIVGRRIFLIGSEKARPRKVLGSRAILSCVAFSRGLGVCRNGAAVRRRRPWCRHSRSIRHRRSRRRRCSCRARCRRCRGYRCG